MWRCGCASTALSCLTRTGTARPAKWRTEHRWPGCRFRRSDCGSIRPWPSAPRWSASPLQRAQTVAQRASRAEFLRVISQAGSIRAGTGGHGAKATTDLAHPAPATHRRLLVAVNDPPLVSAESQLRNLKPTFNRACVNGIGGGAPLLHRSRRVRRRAPALLVGCVAVRGSSRPALMPQVVSQGTNERETALPFTPICPTFAPPEEKKHRAFPLSA